MAHLGLDDVNKPIDSEGRTMHVGVNKNEIANRIIAVGDHHRAELVSQWLDNPKQIIITKSKRNFHTYTGLFNGVPVSIIATGMGISNTDFLVREARFVVEGPMAFVRFGTCGILTDKIPPGCIEVPHSSIMIQTNWDFDFDNDPVDEAFHISKPCKANPQLSSSLINAIGRNIGKDKIFSGIDGTADSFYSSQGRSDNHFKEKNFKLLDQLIKKYPEMHILEMETHIFYKLAELSLEPKIYASCGCITLFNRITNEILPDKEGKYLEFAGGKSLLEGITEFQFPEGEPENTKRLIEIIQKK